MRSRILLTLAATAVAASVFGFAGTAAATAGDSSSGHGATTNDDGSRRSFSFSAHENADGTATGHATLTNAQYTGTNGTSPYRLNIDVSCLSVVGDTAYFGGTIRNTNDPSLVDAVFWSVQDNGEPGAGVNRMSPVYFWDDDPTTTGDPQTCTLIQAGDFAMNPIESGNIQVDAA
jgi:hypothetical protein